MIPFVHIFLAVKNRALKVYHVRMLLLIVETTHLLPVYFFSLNSFNDLS